MQRRTLSTRTPESQEVSSILIGVFDPHQHIKNQITVRVNFGDDGIFKSEINRLNTPPPEYVLIVDGVDENVTNLNLEWFDSRTDRKYGSYTCP